MDDMLYMSIDASDGVMFFPFNEDGFSEMCEINANEGNTFYVIQIKEKISIKYSPKIETFTTGELLDVGQ